MDTEIKNCQNCKKDFDIKPEDFVFYRKIDVPPPTWCPECRMIRRFVWRNERQLFRRPDSKTGAEMFSSIPKEAPLTVYERGYWWSDAWDPLAYGREYDFSRPFFEQLKELMQVVPWPSRSVLNVTGSDYCANVADVKNSYLCFSGIDIENSAYVVNFRTVREGFDLYQSRHSELCYDSYMVDEAYRVFFSVNCEACTDVWFSKNCIGCSNCFGCVNLRNKSYWLFNKPVGKERYREFLDSFSSGSFSAVALMRRRAENAWLQFPNKYALIIQVANSTGEHIEHTKNVTRGYSVHGAENLAYCQFAEEKVSDSYDCTILKEGGSENYESCVVAFGAARVRFGYACHTSVKNLEYSIFCPSSSDCFGCVGLKKKQYCILNKPYSKDDFFALREKIVKHMHEMPYRVKSKYQNPNTKQFEEREIAYTYGEFFPPEFSPFAYNETIAQDFFPLDAAAAKARGVAWREPERRGYETTMDANNLPDHIQDGDDSVVKEIIQCAACGRAYRIVSVELQFYRRIPLPLPRTCPECRFRERFKFVNPPKLWPGKCMCIGKKSETRSSKFETGFAYENTATHFHGTDHCPNEFETSYPPESPAIVYCEACYQAEVI